MKVFNAPEYNSEILTKFLKGLARKEGIINKRELETLEEIRVVHRPFRKIMWKLESPSGSEEKTSTSFVDEQLSSSISDNDHRFLLWRPRYANLEVLESDESEADYSERDNTQAVQKVVDDLILHRWKGQEFDDELRPKLRSLQADPLTAIALIIPRSPDSLRGEEKILAERKGIHSFVLASSLIANCSAKDIMIAVGIGERVYVKTIIVEYREVSTDNLRVLLLETPGSTTLRDAQKSGSALTRICELYPECMKIVG